MPNLNAPTGPNRYSGWYRDQLNDVLEAYYKGTLIFRSSTSATTIPIATTFSSTVTGTTLTASTGAVTANTTGFVSTTGNLKMGTPGAFATTQPQAAVVMGGSSLTGIAPVGAITTAGAIFASDTVVMKIIAAGTANNVET